MNDLKIILVDHEESSLLDLQNLIPWSELGYELVGVFSCGKDALDYISNNSVDVICTDICMPKPDGFDIAEICDRDYPHIKILLLSAFREFEYAKKALRYKNVCDYLIKPIVYEDTAEALKKIAASSVPKTSVFSSLEDTNKRISFFSHLLCGNISDEDELTKKLAELNIDVVPNDSSCSLIMFNIENFQDFLKKTTKYSSLQLYYAMSNLHPFSTDDGYFSLALYSLSNVMWIIIHKQNQKKTEAVIKKFIADMKENFNSILGISVDVTYNQKSPSLLELSGKRADQVPDMVVSSNNNVIGRALDYINKNWDKNISLDEVAQHVFLCPAYFSSYFKKKTGERFIDKLTAIRMKHAATLLVNNEDMSLADICEKIGYNHIGYFYRKFKSFYGVTPTEYRNQNKIR